jgi:hypothetical protein
MSISQMSATMQKAIIERVRKAVLDSTSEGKSAFVQYTEKGKVREGYADGSPFDLDAIRTTTNLASNGYESIVSRGSLSGLAASFAKLAKDAELSSEEVSLASAAAELLAKDGIYTGFKAYIEKLYGIGKATGSPSKTGFTYQRAKASDVKIGTNINDSEQDFISFRNLNHGDLKSLFNKYLKEESIADKTMIDYLVKSLDAGHLTGVFNIKLRNVLNLTVTQKDVHDYRSISATSGTDEELNKLFTSMMLLLSDADFLSSNIVRDVELFSTTSKRVYTRNSPQVSVELQLKVNNGKAGAKLSGLGAALNKLVKSADRIKSRVDSVAAQQALGSALKNFATVAEYVQQLGKNLDSEKLSEAGKLKVMAIMRDAKTAQEFFTTKGSDSLKESIEKTFVNIIAGKKLPEQQISTAKKTTKIKLPSKGTAKKTVVVVTKPKRATTKVPTVTKVNEVSDLSNLQLLLDRKLAVQIEENMGTGSATNVLNYRTGRLAESAKVERLSKSREGMITAFYTYMKNPYATFSEGGLQSSPRSRDPKLLISKSIRELGASMAYTRMRAILV